MQPSIDITSVGERPIETKPKIRGFQPGVRDINRNDARSRAIDFKKFP